MLPAPSLGAENAARSNQRELRGHDYCCNVGLVMAVMTMLLALTPMIDINIIYLTIDATDQLVTMGMKGHWETDKGRGGRVATRKNARGYPPLRETAVHFYNFFELVRERGVKLNLRPFGGVIGLFTPRLTERPNSCKGDDILPVLARAMTNVTSTVNLNHIFTMHLMAVVSPAHESANISR